MPASLPRPGRTRKTDLLAPDPSHTWGMDAKRLLIFGTVARAGSLAAAARELGWTQPEVSQHVRALERHLRMPLIVGGARGTVPTEAGLVLLGHADAIAALRKYVGAAPIVWMIGKGSS